jgi:hypothetical protein
MSHVSNLHERFAHVGVYCRTAGAIVRDVTLSPGASLILGGSTDATIPISAEFGIHQLEVIREGRLLLFDDLHRVNMMIDHGLVDHVQGSPAELRAAGITSPAPLRWARLNLTVRPGLSLFVLYLPPGVSSREKRAQPRAM